MENRNTYYTDKEIRDMEMLKLQNRIKELEEEVKIQKEVIIRLHNNAK